MDTWPLWLAGGGVVAWLLMRGRSATAAPAPAPVPVTSRPVASRPTTSTTTTRLPAFLSYSSEPDWVQRGTPLVQRLYRSSAAALTFYLQAGLYSGGFDDDAPTGTWTPAWYDAYGRAAELVPGLPEGATPGESENVAVVTGAAFYNVPRLRLVPDLVLPQPLIDAINARARSLYARAMPLQVQGELV